jgi:hypothetical protein
MPDDLVSAVWEWLNSDSAVAAALGQVDGGQKVWSVGSAPNYVALPYVVIHDSDDEYTYEAPTAPTRLETGDMQIDVFAQTSTLAKSLGQLIIASLKDQDFALTNADTIYLRCRTRSCTLDPDPGTDGLDVWHEVMLFHTIVDSNI